MILNHVAQVIIGNTGSGEPVGFITIGSRELVAFHHCHASIPRSKLVCAWLAKSHFFCFLTQGSKLLFLGRANQIAFDSLPKSPAASTALTLGRFNFGKIGFSSLGVDELWWFLEVAKLKLNLTI